MLSDGRKEILVSAYGHSSETKFLRTVSYLDHKTYGTEWVTVAGAYTVKGRRANSPDDQRVGGSGTGGDAGRGLAHPAAVPVPQDWVSNCIVRPLSGAPPGMQPSAPVKITLLLMPIRVIK